MVLSSDSKLVWIGHSPMRGFLGVRALKGGNGLSTRPVWPRCEAGKGQAGSAHRQAAWRDPVMKKGTRLFTRMPHVCKPLSRSSVVRGLGGRGLAFLQHAVDHHHGALEVGNRVLQFLSCRLHKWGVEGSAYR